LHVTIARLSRFVRRGDVFAEMVEDDGLTGVRKRGDRAERFV